MCEKSLKQGINCRYEFVQGEKTLASYCSVIANPASAAL